MRLTFERAGWEDYTYWQRHDRAVLRRVNRLIEAAMRDPTSGIGMPEPLKWEFQCVWSRRISDEHRLVYLVNEGEIIVLAARFHYTADH